jgi:tRNA(Ile)-lysidine synthase
MASSRKSSSAERAVGPVAAAERLLRAIDLRGATLAVGFSGGVDSTVLLHVLSALAPRFGFALRAVHVNHGISPNSDDWARFCATGCRRLNVPLEIRRVKIGSRRGRGLEEAARQARRAVLEKTRAEAVALAHHLDDQAETVLLNLLRGAGVRGASGMPALGRLGAKLLLRPLLEVPRAELLRYARAQGLRWIEDESNQNPALARNFLRLRVTPLIEQRYPRWRETLARAARHFGEAEGLLAKRFSPAGATDRLRVAQLRDSSLAEAKLLLREHLAAKGLRPPSARRLGEMLRQLTAAAPGARVELTHDGAVVRSYRGELRIEPRPAAPVPFGPVQWTGQPRIALAALGGEVRFKRVRGTGLALAKLEGRPLRLHLRHGGERLQPDPRRPRRTLKNLFQEAGIPAWRRDRLPLLSCGEDLVWVPGLGIDARYRAAAGALGLEPQWLPIRDASH